MKKFALLIIILITVSCEKQPELQWNEIEFYRISEKEIEQLHTTENRENNSEALKELLQDDTKNSLNELHIAVLEKKYTKYQVNENQMKKLSKYFVHYDYAMQKASFALTTFCIPVYRDILVFKKDQKIVGVAKVCFSCTQNYLLFGEIGMRDVTLDYSGLEEALDQLASR